jgi:hypothetical protein
MKHQFIPPPLEKTPPLDDFVDAEQMTTFHEALHPVPHLKSFVSPPHVTAKFGSNPFRRNETVLKQVVKTRFISLPVVIRFDRFFASDPG